MVGVQHADSIIADSTVSPSSPPRSIHEDTKDNDTINCEPLIRAKRVVRTYGRSKPKEGIEDVANDDLGTRARILRTAPLDADDQVIPESDDTIKNTPEFRFAWRDQLRAIDEGLDITENEMISHQLEATPSTIAKDRDASDTRRELSRIDETMYEMS